MTKPDPLELRGLQLTANKLNKQHPPPAYWTRWVVAESEYDGEVIVTFRLSDSMRIIRMNNGRFVPCGYWEDFNDGLILHDEYDTPETIWNPVKPTPAKITITDNSACKRGK